MAITLIIFVTASQDRYAMLLGFKENEKMHEKSSDSVRSGSVIPLPEYLTTGLLKLLCVCHNFLDAWFKS